MKALIQKVKEAKVVVNSKTTGEIKKGLLIFLGIGRDDDLTDIDYLVDKIINLRIFESNNKKMDKSVFEIGGELLIVSQFTLYGSTKKGRRPDFGEAADPKKALNLYKKFIERCRSTGLEVATGEFGAMMEVFLINDGPVTFLIESN
jgi:D-tyrosyl-tRNA(Tyr) deacylase